jgi:DNA-binding response OmpR family regulator
MSSIRLDSIILVVDDHRDTRTLLAEYLLAVVGVRPVTAADGEDALRTAAVRHPQVVILDLGLPGELDGCEVARRIKAGSGSKVTIIAVTGYGTEADEQRARDAGCDHFFVKPCCLDQVADVVRRSIDTRSWS